jgi:hypothetical protein
MERRPRHTSLRLAAAQVALLAILPSSSCASATSARGPPVSVDIALERARQALCTGGGIESPRALIAAFEPEPPCTQAAAEARVRCYLARPDTTVEVRPEGGGFRIRFIVPQLSDHVHDVSVRARADGTLAVSVDSAN